MTGVMSTAWSFWRTATRHFQTTGKWLWQNAFSQWHQTLAWPPKVWFTSMWSCWLITQVGKREQRKSLRLWLKVLDSKVSESSAVLSTHTSWNFLRSFKFIFFRVDSCQLLHLSFEIVIGLWCYLHESFPGKKKCFNFLLNTVRKIIMRKFNVIPPI